MSDLTRKKGRDKLAARREPYWLRLKEGAYLGFRRGPDTWVARWRDRTKRQHYHALGEALEYDEAKERAEAWLEQIAGAAVRAPKRGTVREALETYLADLRAQGRPDTAAEVEGRYKTCVWDDELAAVKLEALTREDILEWRTRLQKGRQNRSVNRQVRAVKAGLTRARTLGHVADADAWDIEALADDRDDDGETAVFLTAAQRAALIAAAEPHLAAFLRGLELTGARPKELAAATVGDLQGDQLKLSHRKGRPPKLRSRMTMLSAEGAAFFKVQAKDKLPGAPLFTEDGEQTWRRHMWSRGIRAALTAHNKKAEGNKRIPDKASAYSFRHARISELLQNYGIDPLTVAAQTGTSIAMIERSYLKFIPNAMRQKLAAVTGAGM